MISMDSAETMDFSSGDKFYVYYISINQPTAKTFLSKFENTEKKVTNGEGDDYHVKFLKRYISTKYIFPLLHHLLTKSFCF